MSIWAAIALVSIGVVTWVSVVISDFLWWRKEHRGWRQEFESLRAELIRVMFR